jgi:hypothetical protein
MVKMPKNNLIPIYTNLYLSGVPIWLVEEKPRISSSLLIYGNQQYPFENCYGIQVQVIPVMSTITCTEAKILRKLPTCRVSISQVIYNFNLSYIASNLNCKNRK